MTGRFYVLVGAVVIAVAAAIVGLRTKRAAPVAVADAPDAPVESLAIEGQIVEIIDVPRYTYLRLRTATGAQQWAAVSTAKVDKGQTVRIVNAMQMTAFQSTTLKRTFDTIYFGTIAGAQGAPAANPHGAGTPSANVVVPRAERAEGPTGRTIAALYAERRQLAGKPVRVRATVVKSTPSVLGHTFLHVRDGTGSAAQGDFDLAVATDDSPAVGETVVIDGTLAVDKELGVQVRYDVLLEAAKVIGK